MSELDGRNGSNRAAGNHALITADNDLDALHAWLVCFVDTNTTFDNYRKEADRLLLWAHVELHKPVSPLTHEDLPAYQRFLADAPPAARWIMRKGRKVARSHPNWRPFAGPLAPSSQRHALIPALPELAAGRGRLERDSAEMAPRIAGLAPCQAHLFMLFAARDHLFGNHLHRLRMQR